MKKKITLYIFLVLTSAAANGQGTWANVPNITDTINAVHFSDNEHGYISCWHNKIFKTSNGGLSWTNVTPTLTSTSSSCSYTKIFTLDSMTAFAGTGCYDFIIRTYDGGLSWDSVQIFFQPWSVGFFNDSVGLVFAPGGMYKTTDRGNSWLPLNTISCRQGFYFLNDSVGFIGGGGSNIYKTIDQGLTWQTYNTGMPGNTNAIFFFNSSKGIAVDGSGYWSLTYDSGLTWSAFYHGAVFSQWDVHFVNDSLGFIIYNGPNTFLESTDGGISWHYINSNCSSGLAGMTFPSDCIGYVTGADRILKYTDTTCLNATLIYPLTNEQQLLNVFPNPSVSEITLTLGEKRKCFVQLRNMLEEILFEVVTVDEQIKIDVRNFPSGMYFVTVKDEQNNLQVRKIIKM